MALVRTLQEITSVGLAVLAGEEEHHTTCMNQKAYNHLSRKLQEESDRDSMLTVG